MDAVFAFVPEERRVQYSAMTGQSLFYMGETDLKPKVLAIVEEAGAQRASYALKLLQSEGVLTIASTGKDPATGAAADPSISRRRAGDDLPHHDGHRHRRRAAEPLPGADGERGPGADPGDPPDTARVADHRRSAAKTGSNRAAASASQRAAALEAGGGGKPLRAGSDVPRRPDPDAARSHEVPDTHPGHRASASASTATEDEGASGQAVRVHRSHARRHRRRQQTHGGGAGARSLDELPPQTRRLLLLVDAMVAAECKRQKIERTDYRFSRRDVRAVTGWGDTQLRLHLGRLEELEYLLAHRGGRGQSFVYELAFAVKGDGGGPVMPGLIDIEKLGGHKDDGNLAGAEPEFAGLEDENAGPKRPHIGGVAGGARGHSSPMSIGVPGLFLRECAEKHSSGRRRRLAGRSPIVAS